jgi:hypothetical protein
MSDHLDLNEIEGLETKLVEDLLMMAAAVLCKHPTTKSAEFLVETVVFCHNELKKRKKELE